MASMSDIVFLLLIFMLLAMTMINPNALKLTLPQSSNKIQEKAYTTVSIDANLRYYVELEPVALGELERVLKTRLGDIAEPTISLHCDQSVPINEVVKVMNIAKNNQYRLILATNPE